MNTLNSNPQYFRRFVQWFDRWMFEIITIGAWGVVFALIHFKT